MRGLSRGKSLDIYKKIAYSVNINCDRGALSNEYPGIYRHAGQKPGKGVIAEVDSSA